jgi:hypothetical protein
MAVSVGIVLLVLISVLALGTLLINLLLASAPRRGKRPDVASPAPAPRNAPRHAPAPRRYFSAEVDFYLRDWLTGETGASGATGASCATWLSGHPEDEARFYRFVGALLAYYPAASEAGGPSRPDPMEVGRKLLLACRDRGIPLDPFARKRIGELARRVQILYDFTDAHAREPQSRSQQPGGLPPDRG